MSLRNINITLGPYSNRTVLALVLSASGLWAANSYRAFLRHVGHGTELAMPRPVFWMLALAMSPFTKETISTSVYQKDKNQETWLGLNNSKDLLERRGDRPVIGQFCVPHRQVDRYPSEEMKERIQSLLYAIAERNSDLVKIAASPHERIIDGIILRDDVASPHKVADASLREVAHVHPQDASLHVVLSPNDCRLVIERGWGERHPMSGTFALPSQYVFLYAPRNQEELDTVERIIVASIGFMAGTHNAH